MKKIVLFISVLMMVSVAAAQPSNPGGNPFNGFVDNVDNFVESLEVRMAGAIGGPELKSKALANNANESLREAKKLSDQNRSEEAAQRIEKYNRQMNRSLEAAEQANSSRLDSQLSNVSGKNIEVLKKVRDNVPEQAKQGIQKAIDNAEKARGKPVMNKNLGQGGEEAGKPNISNKVKERAGNPGVGKPREKSNTSNGTMKEDLETMNRTVGFRENFSGNSSDRVEKNVENTSDKVRGASGTENKSGEKDLGEQDETVVDEGSVDGGTAGDGSRNEGGLGLP